MAMPASVPPHDQLTIGRRGRRSHHSQCDRDARGATGPAGSALRMTRLSPVFALMSVALMLSHPGYAFGQGPPPTPPPMTAEPLPISGSAPTGSVTPIQTPNPETRGGNALNGSIQIDGSFQGSTPTGVATPEPLPLNLGEAVRRGLAYNLGVIGATDIERTARAGRREALSRLLPDLTGNITVADEQVSLATLGLQASKN